MTDHTIRCDCGSIEIVLHGKPKVQAICHCRSCQNLLHVALNRLAAWDRDSSTVIRGSDRIGNFKYPGKELRRYWCSDCGAPLYDTNRFGFLVFSQALLGKSLGDTAVSKLAPDKHIFYADRVVDVADALPKFMQGIDGPLFKE